MMGGGGLRGACRGESVWRVCEGGVVTRDTDVTTDVSYASHSLYEGGCVWGVGCGGEEGRGAGR